MKANFDGARWNLARAYNDLMEVMPDVNMSQKKAANNLRAAVGALLCIHDPDNPNDCSDLSHRIGLLGPEGDRI